MHFRDVLFPFCRSWILNYIISFPQIRCQIGLCIHSFNHVFSSGFSGVPFDRENSLRMNTCFLQIFTQRVFQKKIPCAPVTLLNRKSQVLLTLSSDKALAGGMCGSSFLSVVMFSNIISFHVISCGLR